MDTRTIVAGAAASIAGGVAGSRLMDPVTTTLYERESEHDKRRERQASKGASAPTVAARKAAGLVGAELDEREAARAGGLLHYLTGISAGPLYVWLRHGRGMSPMAAGLAAGMALFVVVDEVANPILGTSGPPGAYPAATHWRGLIGHAVFGLGLAAGAEVVLALFGRRPAD